MMDRRWREFLVAAAVMTLVGLVVVLILAATAMHTN